MALMTRLSIVLLLKDAAREFLAMLISELWNTLQNPGIGVLSDIFARVGGPDTDRKIGAFASDAD